MCFGRAKEEEAGKVKCQCAAVDCHPSHDCRNDVTELIVSESGHATLHVCDACFNEYMADDDCLYSYFRPVNREVTK